MLLSLNVTLFFLLLSFPLCSSFLERKIGWKELGVKDERKKESSGLCFCHSMLLFLFFYYSTLSYMLILCRKENWLEEVGASILWVTPGSTMLWAPGSLMLPSLEGVTWHKAPAEELTKTFLPFDSWQVSTGYNKNKLKMYKRRSHYGGLPDLRSLRQIGGWKPKRSHRVGHNEPTPTMNDEW